MNRHWMEHQRRVREDAASGRRTDDREEPWHYGRDTDDEVHELPPRLDTSVRLDAGQDQDVAA